MKNHLFMREKTKARLILPIMLGALYLGQCVWFMATQSLTVDEPAHIVSGMEALRYHRFEFLNDQPPLSRLLYAVACRASCPIHPATMVKGYLGYEVPRQQPDAAQSIAWRVRPVNVLLGLLLAAALWAAAREFFGENAANFALALLALSPALIAHFSVATTDGAGILFIFLSALQLVRWRRQPARRRTAWLGLCLGALLLSKFYAPPIFLLALILVLVLKPRGAMLNPLHWNWASAGAIFVIAFFMVWAGYFFHVSRVTLRDGRFVATFPNRAPLVREVPTPHSVSLLVPAGEYLEGLRSVARHDLGGHMAFFLGEISKKGGWKSYYPVVILLKWPTLVVVLGLVTGVLAARGRIHLPRELIPMALFPAVFFLFAIFSKIDIGDRHILPLYPFWLLLVAGVWQAAEGKRLGMALLAAAVALQAADTLRYAPDYLSYFTPLVSPARTYQLLSDSNLDWGQGLLALRRYEAEHPGQKYYLAYFGDIDPSFYGLRSYLPLGPNQRVSGTVIVSSTFLSGQLLPDPNTFRWLLAFPQKSMLNHTLHVFEVPAQPAEAGNSPVAH